MACRTILTYWQHRTLILVALQPPLELRGKIGTKASRLVPVIVSAFSDLRYSHVTRDRLMYVHLDIEVYNADTFGPHSKMLAFWLYMMMDFTLAMLSHPNAQNKG